MFDFFKIIYFSTGSCPREPSVSAGENKPQGDLMSITRQVQNYDHQNWNTNVDFFFIYKKSFIKENIIETNIVKKKGKCTFQNHLLKIHIFKPLRLLEWNIIAFSMTFFYEHSEI